jgi:DNA helicase-2/ATP-dependent DNA helicase PcrA
LNPGEAATDCDPFILSTLHGSKGLEWDNVILIGLNEQEFPGGKPDDVYSVRTSMNTLRPKRKSRRNVGCFMSVSLAQNSS